MRKVALIVGCLVVVLVVAVAIVPRLIGINAFKPQIADAVREATGRELRIDGDIDLALLPGIELSLSDVALSNADWAQAPDMVTVASIEVKLGLLSLLGGGVAVERLVVREPAIFLEQDAQGRGSWAFEGAQTAQRAPSAGEGEAGGPVGDIRLGDVRIEGGRLSFVSAASGQEIAVEALTLTAALPNVDSALDLDGGLVLNGRDVKLDVSLETPGRAMRREPFAVAAELTSALLSAGYVGTVQPQPVPGLDGRMNLDIASVGDLAAWLGRPLDPAQPDPGPLNVAVVLDADGQVVTLQEATVAGESLDLKATGSFDGSGDVRTVVLKVESGLLDIDRYLPPPVEAAAAPMAADAEPSDERPADMLAGLSDAPLDLSVLRETDADITVSLAGIKAAGFEVGRLAFATAVKDGVLAAELSELALYGGKLTGRVDLDGTGAALQADVAFTIDRVDVGALGAALPEPPPVGGVASGDLTASAAGASPRALVESLAGRLAFDLGGLDIQNEQAAALSDLKLAVDLPGLEAPPRLEADLVYNGEAVAIAAGLAPLGEVLSGGPFDARFKLASALVTAVYEGRVQQQPVPGLDGRFDLDMGSVGKLAAWLGRPLPDGQPDPGPLTVAAAFAADGAKVALTEAKLDGKALKATASGSYDGSAAVARFEADVTVERLDVDAYLPPAQEQGAEEQGAANAGAGGNGEAVGGAQGWSEEPLDLGALHRANGAVKIATGPVTYRGLTVAKSLATLLLEGGVAKLDLRELQLAEGSIAAAATVDGSGKDAALDYSATIQGVQAKPLLTAFGGIDWLSGTMNVTTRGKASGQSQKQLVEALDGDGTIQFLDGAVEGVNIAETLRNAQNLNFGGDGGGAQKTDFSELSGSFVITDGVVDNRDFKMLAPLVRLSGAGQVPMPPQTVDYGVEAKLVASLEGQGGDDALAGLPIPIRIQGTWSDPSYDIDWQSVFQAAALDPARLATMPDSLKDAAKGFGVDLPLPDGLPGAEGLGEGLGETLKGVTGDGEAAPGGATGALDGLQKLIDPGAAEDAPPAAESEPQPEPQAQPEDLIEKPLDAVKGLFGN